MVTRNWKIVKGTAEARKGIQSSECVYYQYVENVFDVNGDAVDHITVGPDNSSSNSPYVYNTRSICFGNETIFNRWSDNLNQTEINFYYSTGLYAGGCSKIIFGSDGTEALPSDYKIKLPISEGITKIERNVMTDYNEETNKFEYIITYYGKASNDMVIREVGIVKSVLTTTSYSTVDSSSKYKNILVVRDVLETPLDLKAGEGFRVTIKIEM
ncbi:MAG: hypothetical protein ACI4I9_01745 [Porcipelethomonas sp.]